MALIFESDVMGHVNNDDVSILLLSPKLDPKTLPAIYQPGPLTELAVRYGHAEHPMLKGTGKSAITPISPFKSNDMHSLSPYAVRRAYLHERIQRERLFGFATWELIDGGSWINDDLKPCSLDEVQIHALYEQTQWLDGNIPLGRVGPGVWEAKNPVVWNAIVPSLRLASLLLQLSSTSTWYSTIPYMCPGLSYTPFGSMLWRISLTILTREKVRCSVLRSAKAGPCQRAMLFPSSPRVRGLLIPYTGSWRVYKKLPFSASVLRSSHPNYAYWHRFFKDCVNV